MPSRAGLDREVVVRAAADLADASGGDVTLAAVAEQLGVRTPSLYNHIDGQDGLRRELALLGLRQLSAGLTTAAVGKTTDHALLAVAHAYRRFAREHPGIYAATLRAPDTDDTELQDVTGEIMLVLTAVMNSYGLREDDAIHAIRGLRSMLHGFVTLEAGGGFGIPLDLDESFKRSVWTFIHGLRHADVAGAP